MLDVLAGADIAGIDECIQAGVLHTAGDAVNFRHELARMAVLSAVPPARRRELHRQALEALASPPSGEPDVTRLAHHAEATADPGAISRYAPEWPRFPGATYGEFPAACHFVDGTLESRNEEANCAPTNAETGAAFAFWHGRLITLHVWLWFHNPDGLFAGMNPLVSPFNAGA